MEVPPESAPVLHLDRPEVGAVKHSAEFCVHPSTVAPIRFSDAGVGTPSTQVAERPSFQ